MSAIALDPLIAAAKGRARRRRYLLAAVGLVALGSLVTTWAVRGSDGSRPAVGTRTCRPAELRAEKPRFGGIYTGHVVGSLALQNLSAGSCSLSGSPSVTAILPDGRHVAARVRHVRNVGAPRGGVVLSPGGTASFRVIADDGTGLEGRCGFPLPSVRVLIVPPGATAPARGVTTMPYCRDPRRLLIEVSPVVLGPLDRYGF